MNAAEAGRAGTIQSMITSAEVASGKGAGDENFPVASQLIAKKHRPAVMAFYDFVRAADDVADNATLPPEQKLELLDRMEASLLGRSDAEAVARPLRRVLDERKLSPRHALDLLAAFKLDCTKNRTADWDDLIHYCSLSAMPVGRYVLDVHGESQATWAASDAVCAGLQVLNHLQDCGKDFRSIDRVYLPSDVLARHGVAVTELGAATASPGLRAAIAELADRTIDLFAQGSILPRQVRDFRLSLETAVIIRLAIHLTGLVRGHDPLSEKVHHGKAAFLGRGLLAASVAAVDRLLRPAPPIPAVANRL